MMRVCSPHGKEGASKQGCAATTNTSPNIHSSQHACQKASSLPSLLWSYITVMFLQNVEF